MRNSFHLLLSCPPTHLPASKPLLTDAEIDDHESVHLGGRLVSICFVMNVTVVCSSRV